MSSTFLPIFGFVHDLDFNLSNRCVALSYCFNLQLLLMTYVKHIFICLFVIFLFVSCLVWCILKYFYQFLTQLLAFLSLSFKSSLYHLKPVFYQIRVLKIFAVACLFIFSTVSFTEQKFSILMKLNLSKFSFMDSAFGVVPKKSLPRSFKFSPVLSFRNYIVLLLHLDP